MDGNWNPCRAFDASGRPRGRDHSTKGFCASWRRVALILRGDDVGLLDARLARLHPPPVRTAQAAIPAPQVALLWVPQVSGAPDIKANAPAAYWPGRAYVDWVGTDVYSKFPSFSGLRRFASNPRWKRLPFAFGERAVWGADDPGFVHRLFGWIRGHRHARMAPGWSTAMRFGVPGPVGRRSRPAPSTSQVRPTTTTGATQADVIGNRGSSACPAHVPRIHAWSGSSVNRHARSPPPAMTLR
jgi:hypothetical protein